MPRIPLYTSRAPMRTGSVVMPPSKMGTAVPEAISGLALTVGKVAEDWATAKANTEKQSEYVSNTISYKEAQAEFEKKQQDDPNYLDDKELLSNYTTDMEKVKNSLVWKYDSTKKQFGSTSQLSDSAFMQNSYNLNRRKFIDSKKAQGETNTQNALRLRSKPLLEQNIASLQNVYSKEELKTKENKDYYDLEILQATDKLKIDPNADLSEFKLIEDAKAELIKVEKTRRHNEQIILKREKAEKQAQTQADLQVRAVDEIIPVEELKLLRGKQEISGAFFNTMMARHNPKPVFNSGIYAGYLMEIYEPSGKYKSKVDFINAITKSFHIDGQLDEPSTKSLIGKVLKPPEGKGTNYTQMGIKYINATGLSRIKKDLIINKLSDDIDKGKIEDKQIYDRAVDLTAVVAGREADHWFSTIAGQIEKERGEVTKAKRRVEEAFRVGKITFNPEGTGYDTKTAGEAGLKRKRGHLPSLDPRTGMVLKARKHPTWDLMVKEETKLGNKIVKRGDRYYSVSKTTKIELPKVTGRITSTNPKTGQKIYSDDDGETWRDINTNKVIK